MYDLIGDVHGHAEALEHLLNKLGYTRDKSDVWRHPTRKVIFLGDLIDRGPAQLEVIRIARDMVETDSALAVMGNHEFNAILYATENPARPGTFLREHNEGNKEQHHKFLKAVGSEGFATLSDQHLEVINWFKTLPCYLDLEEFRVIHACWHPPSFKVLAEHLDSNQRFREEAWPHVGRKGTDAYKAAEILLKGWEIPLPPGASFLDKGNKRRRDIRTRWWETANRTYRDLALVPAAELDRIPDSSVVMNTVPGYDGEKPLFLGHYWLDGEPAPLTEQICCLDYSIASEHAAATSPGRLCAYRFDGESRLTKGNLVWVEG